MFDFFTYLAKGGLVMIPLGLCSILSLAIIFDRLWNLRLSKILPPQFLDTIKRQLNQKNFADALELCQKTWQPISRILEAGILKHEKSSEEIKATIENVGKQEVIFLERYLDALATIASVSPLLGLLGSVSGLIKSFHVITLQGVGDPNALAGGISEALIATAAGLTVAIPTLIFHNYFAQRANTLMLAIEKASLEIFELLSETRHDVLDTQRIDTWEIR